MTDPSPDEQQVARLLDDYLEGLQAGERPDRHKLLQEHPELAAAVDCLDALESMASGVFDGALAAMVAVADESKETVAWSSSTLDMPADFGPYELLEEIGRGGMGVVYRARQKDLDRIVAIKMILASHLASPEHVRRFRAEAKAAAAVRHENIVKIHDVGQLHGQHYFVMEHIEGTSLAERVASGPLDAGAAVRLVEQVARAVEHLHQQGIVHRDLKPSNILLDSEGRPCISDFGLAKVLWAQSETTSTGAILGTASYMAPEQAAGHSAEAAPASDVYSLGAIFYELLTGRPPFREENPLDTLMQVLSREPPLPRQLNRDIPRSLELICLKCLAKAPADRYPSAQALADDLERFLKGESLMARPPSLLQRTWTWSRREPALAGRLLVLGIFFIVQMIINAMTPVAEGIHGTILLIFGVWALSAVAFQQLLNKLHRFTFPARFVWGTLDSALLFALLLVADGVASPAVVGYPLLIVGSGLWFRVRFVWFMTSLSLVSYGIHVADFYLYRRDLWTSLDPSQWHRHVVFAVALIAIGAVVGYLVRRVRVLSSYYGQNL